MNSESILYQAWYILEQNFPLFWYGIKTTLLLAISGTLLGLLLGLIFGGIRAVETDSKDTCFIRFIKKILHAFVAVYVWFFRGTPMMVQAMFFYYGLRPILGWDVITAGIIIISLNAGAYMCEIIRSGIQSVDKGQREASRSLGMTSMQTMMYIILPQAVKNSFPSIGNEFVINIKDSSMLNVIGVVELFFQTTSIAGTMGLFTATFMITCSIYLILTSLATVILSAVEKQMNKQAIAGNMQ